MKQLLYLILLSVLISCASRKNIAVDGASAIKISQDTLSIVLDLAELESFRPFKAVLVNGGKVWQVYPRDIIEFGGRLPVLYVKKKDGKIKDITWGEGDIPEEALTAFLRKDIVGAWSMCRKGYDDTVICSNVCPDVIFNEDGSGAYISSNFKWVINGDIISFTFPTEKDKSNFFSSYSEFTFKAYTDEKTLAKYFKLFHKSSNSWFSLGKK